MARLLETDSATNKDISTAVSIGSYTATAARLVHLRVFVSQAAGNGDYVIYATVKLGGSEPEYRVIPITTANAASGVTSLCFVSNAIPLSATDILQCYIAGLAGDNATPDTQVEFWEKDYLRPTVSGRTLDVAATGEAGLDFTNRLDTTGILPSAAAGAASGLAIVGSAMTLAANQDVRNVSGNVTGSVGSVTGLTPGNLDAKISDVPGAVRTNLATELGRIDAAVSTRSTYAGGAVASVTNPVTVGTNNDKSGYSISGTKTTLDSLTEPPTVVAIATQVNSTLSSAHGAGLWGGAAGAGAITFTYTLTSTVGGTAIADADVWVTSDVGGTAILASGKTNASGQVVFYLDAGTVYVWRQKSGWNFTNPDTEVVA